MLLIRLLIAHLCTDFFFRPDLKMIEQSSNDNERKNIKYLLFHTALTTLGAAIAIWDIHLWYLVLIVGVTHFALDYFKIYFTKDELVDFILDQVGHILIIVFVAASADPKMSSALNTLISSPQFSLMILGYLAVSFPTGLLIGKLTQPFRAHIKNDDGLERAGVWIGILERMLVFTFVMINQLSAIGLLIAAKSFLRFSDKSSADIRKHTEYIIIGTFLSFGIALIIGLLIRTYGLTF